MSKNFEPSGSIIIRFGKYKGTMLDDVPASYLLYLYEKEIVKAGDIYEYIVANMDGIKKQIADGSGNV